MAKHNITDPQINSTDASKFFLYKIEKCIDDLNMHAWEIRRCIGEAITACENLKSLCCRLQSKSLHSED